MVNSQFFVFKKLKLKENSNNGSFFYGIQLPIIFFNFKINYYFFIKKKASRKCGSACIEASKI